MGRTGGLRLALAPQAVPMLASVVLVSLIVISGVGYACSNPGNPPPNPNLEVTSVIEISGPSYVHFTPPSFLPSSTATFKVGPFAPGDSVVVSYTVENTGSIGAILSSISAIAPPSGSGFTATDGFVPSTLGPGVSFTSTITITLASGLGDHYEGSVAIISLQINGVSAPTTCTNTVTHTNTITTTAVTTTTITKTVTSTVKTVTSTVTVTKTTTKKGYDLPGGAALWASTTSCVSATITTTVTITHTSTATVTQTTTITTTATVTKTTTTTKTSTCSWHDCD